MPYTVLLVEDDARTRERIARIITANTDLTLLAAAGSLAEACNAMVARPPDVLMLDLGLPDGDGTELIPAALAAHTRVMVLSVFEGPRQRAALAAGAQFCLPKDSSARVIGRAVAALFSEAPASSNHEFM